MRWIFLLICLFLLFMTLERAWRERHRQHHSKSSGEVNGTDFPPSRFWRNRLKTLLMILASSMAFCSLLVIAEYSIMSPRGSRDAIAMITLLFGLIAFVMGCLIILSFIGLCFKATRQGSFILLSTGFIFFFSVFVWGDIAGRIHFHALLAFTERSKVLIGAIKKFNAEHGKPPDTLNELVPKYLPEVPGTGIGAYPEYRYRIMGDSWRLELDVPETPMDFDTLIYLPDQNYDFVGRGWKVGDWMYSDD